MPRERKVHYDGNGYVECKQKGNELAVTTIFENVTCATCKGIVMHNVLEEEMKRKVGTPPITKEQFVDSVDRFMSKLDELADGEVVIHKTSAMGPTETMFDEVENPPKLEMSEPTRGMVDLFVDGKPFSIKDTAVVNYGLSVLPESDKPPWDNPRVFTVEEWAEAQREMKEAVDSYHPSQEQLTPRKIKNQIITDMIKAGEIVEFEAELRTNGDTFELVSVSVVEHGGEPVGLSVGYKPFVGLKIAVEDNITQKAAQLGQTMNQMRYVWGTLLLDTPKPKLSRKQKRALWPKGSPGRTYQGLCEMEAWVEGFDTGICWQMGWPGGDDKNPYNPKSAVAREWNRGFDEGGTCG